jgi:hypothetical protein
MAPLVVIFALSVIESFVFAGRIGPSLCWDSESYLSYAAILSHWRFPGIGLRMPGYPLFLLLFGGSHLHLVNVMVAQLALWCVANCIVLALVRMCTGNLVLSVACSVIAMTFFDLLFIGMTIYSEILALFLVDLAALTTVLAFRGRKQRLWLLITGILWVLSTMVRPVFVAASAAFILTSLIASLRRIIKFKNAAIVSAAVITLLMSYSLTNYKVHGTFRLALGGGLSFLNYVGFPEIYSRLPDEQAQVRDIYLGLSKGGAGPLIPWWEAIPHLMKSFNQEDSAVSRDQMASRVSMRAVLAVPGGYARVWFRTLCAFLSEYHVIYGMYENCSPGGNPRSGNPRWDPSSWGYRIVLSLERWWQRYFCVVTYSSFTIPFLILVLMVGSRRLRVVIDRGTMWGFFSISAVLFFTVLTSTLIEPWPGQMRYRLPLQHLHLVVAVIGFVLLWNACLRWRRH